MPSYPPKPQRRSQVRRRGATPQVAGAGLPLFTTCADVDAYQKELAGAIQGLQDDLAKANALTGDDFSARWFSFYGDWQKFNAGECHWYSFDDSESGLKYRIDHMMVFHDALVKFQAEAKGRGVTPTVPSPDAPTGPTWTDPGKEGDSFGKTIRIVAISGAVIGGAWAAVSLARMFRGED
jgi:hypothetical protein